MSKWVTKDGKKIPISKLENSHLVNILNRFYRRCEVDGVIIAYRDSDGDIGDIESLCELEALDHLDPDDQYSELVKEADKRGLNFKKLNYREKQKRTKFKPLGAVIQTCHTCGKVDVVAGHESSCDPVFQSYRRESLEHGNN
jgi:predicted GTPase